MSFRTTQLDEALLRFPWRAYLEMTKPKVVLLMLLTVLVGMYLAPVLVMPLDRVFFGLLGIGLLSGAGAVFNHVLDQRFDAMMSRTSGRPLPQGEVSSQHALSFGCILLSLGLFVLCAGVNYLTAWLTLASCVGYAFFYTWYLKRATSQNIVTGGLAGAMPPLLGWTSITGEIHAYPLVLVMIIFAWTPPHFWALAIHKRKEYAKAGLPMLPVTHGVLYTKNFIVLYVILLTLICLFPYLIGMSGWFYAAVSTGLNLYFLQLVWRLKNSATNELAMPTFAFSIVHLMVLFVVLLVDHYWLMV